MQLQKLSTKKALNVAISFKLRYFFMTTIPTVFHKTVNQGNNLKSEIYFTCCGNLNVDGDSSASFILNVNYFKEN